MKCAHRLAVIVGILVLCAHALLAQVLQNSEMGRLHPVFQAVVAKNLPQLRLDVVSSERSPAGTAADGSPLYDAIITTRNADAVRSAGIHVNSVYGDFATALLRPDDLVKLARLGDVRYVDPGSIIYPQLDVSVPEIGANLLHAGFLNNTPYKGKNVIVVIYDTGIDWRHLDFRDPIDTLKTRILAIWDQTLTATTGETTPSGFSYGVEYTKTQIEDELDGTPANFVREKDTNGHGTHVASTAAGNGRSVTKRYVGVAPEADIIVVKGGDGSFSENRMIDGLTFAGNKASALGKPVVVNWSIGGHSGPHDGTRAYEVAVDNFVSSPGRVVAISAGNDGGSPIHVGGTLSSSTPTSFTITVPSYTAQSGTNNDEFTLDLWFNTSQSMTATVTSPNNVTFTRTGSEGVSTGPNNSDGTIDLYNYVSSSMNGLRNIQLWVHDQTSNTPGSGTWTLTLSGTPDGVTYDGWLSERTVGSTVVSLGGSNTLKTVSMPGTAQGAITVASYVTKAGWPCYDGRNFVYSSVNVGAISSFSSIGPTRDGRQKPDIAAPGQGITAALSAAVDTSTTGTRVHPGLKHYLIQGTSMASPHVAGVAALLLGISPSLTASQIKSLLISAADVDGTTGGVPNPTWGYGRIDAFEAAARLLSPGATAVRTTYAYDLEGSSSIFSPYLSGSTKYAVRFTPTTSGQLTGLQVNLTTTANRPIGGFGPLVCEVYSNVAGSVGGIPGTKLGQSVLQDFSQLSTGTSNFIDMTPAGVSVSPGQDFHIVVSVYGPSDTIKVRSDNGSAPTSRSSIFKEGKWANVQDPASGQTSGVNLRIRAVVTSVSGLVSVQQFDGIARTFELQQNYPNPFNPSTTIRYSIPVKGQVRLKVYDLIGKVVATLVDQEQLAGNYAAEWSGVTDNGLPASSGVYFCRLESGGYQQTQKMILLK